MPLIAAHILVTRPQPGGDATAARLRGLGHDAVLAPLLAIEAVDWQPPAAPPPAIMLTSAAAVRLAGAAAAAYRALPTFTVGAATARAAVAAGFSDVRGGGGGTAQALVDAVAAQGVPAILHLAGEDRTPVAVPVGLCIETRIVYRARLLPLGGVPDVDWVLLYSARTAAHFAAECDRLGTPRAAIAIAAISNAVAAAAGPGWRASVVAARPDEDALLAAIDAACQKPRNRL